MATTRLSFLGIPAQRYVFAALGITAVVGAYTFTGPDVALKAPRIEPVVGSYTFKGWPVTFGDVNRVTRMSFLGIPGKSYVVDDLSLENTLGASPGNYTFTGPDVLFKSNNIQAVVGSYTFSGPDVTLAYNTGEPANSWFNDITWKAPFWGVNKWWGSVGTAPSYVISPIVADYTFSAADITLKPPFRFTTDTGAYTFSGPNTELVTSGGFTAITGNYTFTGPDVVFTYTTVDTVLSPIVRAYTFSGSAVNLNATLKLNEKMLQRYSDIDPVVTYQLTNERTILIPTGPEQLIPNPEFNNPAAWSIGSILLPTAVTGGTLHIDATLAVTAGIPPTYPTGTISPVNALPVQLGSTYNYELKVSSSVTPSGSILVLFGNELIWHTAFGAGTFSGEITVEDISPAVPQYGYGFKVVVTGASASAIFNSVSITVV